MSHLQTGMNGVSKVISMHLLVYSIPTTVSPVIFLDHTAAIAFARVIDSINPRPLAIEVLYALCQENLYQAHKSSQEILSIEQLLLLRLSPAILAPVKTREGKGFYRVDCAATLSYVEKETLEWEVTYHPEEVFQQTRQAILELQSEYYLSVTTTTAMEPPILPMNSIEQQQQSSVASYANFSMNNNLFPINSFTPAMELAMEGIKVYSACNTPTPAVMAQPEQGQSGQIQVEGPTVQNEPVQNQFIQAEQCHQFQTPVIQQRGPFQAGLDAIVRGMDGDWEISTPSPTPSRSQPPSFIPTSDFTLSDKEAKEDKRAAEQIVNTFKVLAINPSFSSMTKSRDSQYSIVQERLAIRSMSVDTSLNIDTQTRTLPQKIKELFVRYDRPDEKYEESFQKALLMVAIRLLRQSFVNESGARKKRPGNYAMDFDTMYEFPRGFIRQAGRLCRLIVACGHPCIVLVMVRLAIRNKKKLSNLLEELPISHLSRFIARGKVTDINTAPTISTSNPAGRRESSVHDNLSWLHDNVVLPLLHEASRRIPAQLNLVEGSVTCDQDTCQRASVHPTQQNRYSDFLAGHFHDQDFSRGRVLLEVSTVDKQVKKEYSIEKTSRTFHHTNASAYSHIGHFTEPPQFLRTRTLALSME